MLLGKQYRLDRATAGIRFSGGKGEFFRLPEGAVVSVDSEPDEEHRFIQIRYLDQPISIFVVDLLERGEELENESWWAAAS